MQNLPHHPSFILDPGAYIKEEASKCVACGLCLPHCPTYGLLQDEAESPRGRLALMLALANDDLPLSPRLESHLARCLACRACEKVCPSYVAYGKTLDMARTVINRTRTVPPPAGIRSVNLLHWLVAKPGRTRALGRILRLYQRSGLQSVLRASGVLRLFGLAGLEANLPHIHSSLPAAEIYPARNNIRGRVAIFTGCLADVTEQPTLAAAIRLLTHAGYEVHRPPGQGCCGAMHLHDGQPETAVKLMRRNIAAFADRVDVIVGVASGCTATLKEYEKYLGDGASAATFSARVMDINQFIAQMPWPPDLAFRPLAKRIAVHDPCTLTNVLRQEDKPYMLLARIPGAEIFPLAENSLCCGAAGTYHLSQAPLAQRLRTPKIADLKRLAPDILVTSNSGCAMYLAAGLREAGLAIEVIHPVVLLERQLQVTGGK